MPVLLILVGLIGLNVLFVLMEYALVRVRPARIELLARQGNSRAIRVQEMLVHLDDYLAAIQVGITLVALALGAFAEPPITALLQSSTERLLGDLPDGPLRVISLVSAFGALAYAQIVIGELLPRAIALHKAEALALWGAGPLKLFAVLCRLPVRAMSASAAALLRVIRLKPSTEAEANISEEEIRLLLSESQERGTLPFERLILHENIFDLSQAKACDAMTPRDRIAFLSLGKPWSENLGVIKNRRLTRYPLCRDGLESVIGFVHVKDLFLQASAPDLEKARRDITVVLETEPVERMLRIFPDKGTHLALVKDGNGTVSGLVTMEDLIEELVGEVQDEFDMPQAWSLSEVVVPSAVALQLEAAGVEDAIRQLSDRLAPAAGITSEAALTALLDRERRFSSAVGRGVAVPHARLPDLKRSFVALGRFAKPVPFAALPDRVPVRLVFLILTPANVPVAQLRILSRIAALASNETVRRRLMRAKTGEALLEAIKTADTLLAS